MRDALSYVDVNGVLTRRGLWVPPPPPLLFEETFEGITVANPISAADFKATTHDATFGDLATQRALMQAMNYGGAEGKGIRTTLPATYYTGGNTGVAFGGIKLGRHLETIVQTFRMRFGAGFEIAKGGKAGPGIGGFVPTSAPVSPHNSPSTAPSGGNSTPYGWSVRPEWGSDGRIHELCYLPGRAKYDGSVVYGIGRALNYTPPATGTWFTYERRITLNTSFAHDSAVDPRTLVLGTDYLADGIHEVLIDGVQVYYKNNEVFRFYSGAKAKNMMWSYFRGGGDTTWNATTAGSYFDICYHKIAETP